MDYQKMLQNYREKLKKALTYLEYSYNKIARLGLQPNMTDPENLEVWESFATRFARVVDLFLTKYLRAYVLTQDPGFEGSLRDFVNQAEKLHLIDDASQWMSLRELRNITTHEYVETDLQHFLLRLYKETPVLLQLKDRVNNAN